MTFSTRGRLASTMTFIKNVGVMTSHILGSSVDYFNVPRICIVLPIAFLIIFQMWPNSPQYHLRKGHFQVILQ